MIERLGKYQKFCEFVTNSVPPQQTGVAAPTTGAPALTPEQKAKRIKDLAALVATGKALPQHIEELNLLTAKPTVNASYERGYLQNFILKEADKDGDGKEDPNQAVKDISHPDQHDAVDKLGKQQQPQPEEKEEDTSFRSPELLKYAKMIYRATFNIEPWQWQDELDKGNGWEPDLWGDPYEWLNDFASPKIEDIMHQSVSPNQADSEGMSKSNAGNKEVGAKPMDKEDLLNWAEWIDEALKRPNLAKPEREQGKPDSLNSMLAKEPTFDSLFMNEDMVEQFKSYFSNIHESFHRFSQTIDGSYGTMGT